LHDGRNYDVWFDYVRVEEGAVRIQKRERGTKEEADATAQRVRYVYERAVTQVPAGQEKRHWRRYTYLLVAGLCTLRGDRDKTSRQVYRTTLSSLLQKSVDYVTS